MSKIAGGDIEEGIVSEKTPLVPQKEEEEDDEKLGEIPENTTKELIITGLAVVTGSSLWFVRLFICLFVYLFVCFICH